MDVARLHADYDRHPDDRIGLFSAVAEVVPREVPVLYPGSYAYLFRRSTGVRE